MFEYNKIVMTAFNDELSKNAGFATKAVETALNWARKARTAGTASALEGVDILKATGKDTGRLGANLTTEQTGRNFATKVRQFFPNMASNAVLNVHSLFTDPMTVLKGQLASYSHKMKNVNGVMTAVPREYGANWEGVKDWTHAITKPVTGAGVIGGAGIYTMDRLSGEGQGKSIGDAATWTASPAAGMTKDLGTMGYNMHKAKKQDFSA